MLPFGIGILVGRSIDKIHFSMSRWFWAMVVVIVSALIFVMCFHYQSWLWIPILIIVGTIAIVKAMSQKMMNLMVWFGSISAAMFVAHPIARKLFINVALRQDIYDGLMLYVIATIALSWAVKKIIDQIPSPKL